MQKTDLKEYIDNTVKNLLEGKKPVIKMGNIISENIHKMEKNYTLLREYIECDPNDNECNGDEMLDSEISDIDTNIPEINKFIENIKAEALDAMTQLSRNGESNSQTFETLKKVFDVCHNTQKKKDKQPIE